MNDEIKIFEKDNQLWTNSQVVAEKFGKRHDNVLPVIEKLKEECSGEFMLLNFKEDTYKDKRGNTQPMYNMTRDGFSMLVTRFTGKKATQWTEKFIGAFNSIEKTLIRLARNAHVINQFVLPGPTKWKKRFSDEYYKEIYRLNKWEWKGPPYYSVVGTWTKDFYNRLPKGILGELEKLNPSDENGNRKYKHHQLLTEDVGIPALRYFIMALTALMSASNSWGQFVRLCRKAYPIGGEQFDFFIEE